MKRLAVISILFFAFLPIPLFSQTSDDEDEVEKTGGLFPAEAQGEDSSQIQADRQQLGNFQKLPAPEFTADLRISSQTQRETRPNYFVLEGYVDINYGGMRLQADHAEFNTETQDLIASGNVVLDQEGQRITGDRLELNLETKRGIVYNAFGYVPPQIFFWGSKLEKLGEDEYRLIDGVFTECSQLLPHWQLNTSSATMTINEYIRFTNFTLKAKKMPIFYSPYMIWPIRRERATGFLFPGFGPNSRKGFWVGGSFFWAMTRSMDTTYWLDHWQERGFGGGVEYRYASSKTSTGSVKSYYADDRVFGPQWSMDSQFNQDLPSDFRIAGVVDIFSSFEYEQDTEDNFSRAALRSQRAQTFLTRNWSYYSLNALGDWSNTQFNRGNEVQLYHAPELEFQSRSQQLGPTPFFWTLLTSFNQLGKGEKSNTIDDSFTLQRYDVFPTISWPITYLSWLTLTPTFGYRYTHYSRSQDPLQPGTRGVLDEALTRDYMDLTLDLRGPNFAKIFDTPNTGYSKKWKHAIEPQVTYRYIEDIDEFEELIRIDEVDSIRGVRAVTYSITNLLYAKRPVKEEPDYDPDEYQYYNPKPLEEPVESPWEFISWRLSQSYLLNSDTFDPTANPELKRFSPIASVLRVNPSQHYNVEFRLDYDISFKQISTIQVNSTLRNTDVWYANLSYNYFQPTPFGGRRQFPTNQIRSNAGVGLWKNRLVLNGEIDYDIENKKVFRNSLGFLYNDDCFTVGMEWRHYDFGDQMDRAGIRDENQFTFTVSLPNIGELVKYRNGAPPRRF